MNSAKQEQDVLASFPGTRWVLAVPTRGAKEGKGSPLPGRVQPCWPCSLTAPGAPASLKLHLLVILGFRERQVAEMCTFSIPPPSALGGTNPPHHGCPLHVAHSLLISPSTHGTASRKVPFCLLFLQQYPQSAASASTTNCFPLEWDKWTLGPGEHCGQKISVSWDQAVPCSSQSSCCVMMLQTSRLFATAFPFISPVKPHVHRFS